MKRCTCLYDQYQREPQEGKPEPEKFTEHASDCVITLESELSTARAQLDEVRNLAERVEQTRTAWFEQHGVPISQEFVRFAEAVGELLAVLYRKE